MLKVTEFPLHRLTEGELRLREWEAVMAHGFGSAAHLRCRDEISRRGADAVPLSQPPRTH